MAENERPKAAALGEPSYVWRAGQERRWRMIEAAAGKRLAGSVLDNGCGVGLYLRRLAGSAQRAVGVELDFERGAQAKSAAPVVNAAAEALPLASAAFDLILSHEVLEHVADDQAALAEMARLLRPGGRLVLFVPNRGYPFETHGVYWRGRYRFGNIPLVNYLPRRWRDRLAPHVRAYRTSDIAHLLQGLPAKVVERRVLFGAYDNIIARWPPVGRGLRAVLQRLERTPLRVLGLSHFWVVEKLFHSPANPSDGPALRSGTPVRPPEGPS
ncbi:MAG: class I SAM-dependent methyltransferase [Anaerolineales bacterium]|nr:class I SAM-dependent methyltransferase [Anaerolineales bacterium]